MPVDVAFDQHESKTMTQMLAVTVSDPVLQDRIGRLGREISIALQQTTAADLRSLGVGIGKNFGIAAVRRLRNVAVLGRRVVTGAAQETYDAYKAVGAGHLAQHARGRSSALGTGLKSHWYQASEFGKGFLESFRTSPKDAGAQLVTLVITSVLVSGGVDGDGGAPDLDLAFGIDAHRSFLSHSILMGTALETGILALLQLVQMAHKNLPSDHDHIWDELLHHSNNMALSAAQGASLGMAYHLFMDGLVQPAPYTDIPVPMSMEMHQSLFVANAAGEVIDVKNKKASG